MIKAAKYNGINFSDDFNRESDLINYDNQRNIQIVECISQPIHLSFFSDTSDEPVLIVHYFNRSNEYFYPLPTLAVSGGFVHTFEVNYVAGIAYLGLLNFDSEIIYSEICNFVTNDYLVNNNISKIIAYNNDATHGYNTSDYPAFGFFKKSELNRDFFINETTEYEYSYGRKMVLGSENQIAKRFTFHNLSMYQQNLLKWLCKCENLYIDGVGYQLVSDFTELLKDENTEICDLRADFVEADQSFFSSGASKAPTNVFQKAFFMK
jgi:hypothetical protein